ncbi:MAG TPA: putative peptide maturation dehydrogenase [Stenotrophomonas sp.]|jgi:putative peptide maturation dehydrogenase
MRVRRCAIVLLEPREETALDIGALLAGGNGLARRRHWLALAAHLDAPVEVDLAQREALATIPVEAWSDPASIGVSPSVLEALLDAALVLREDDTSKPRQQDDAVRKANWWPLSALAHRHARWAGLDSVAAMDASGMREVAGLRKRLGPPPSAIVERVPAAERVALPHVPDDALDQHWMTRCTCRNFDASKSLTAEMLGVMLQRVLMAKSVFAQEDMQFLKTNVASGGGLHPISTYLLVQRVDGIEPGLYHYHALDHALEPLPAASQAPRDLAMRLMAGQHWFADAPVLVLLAARFQRSFWKYRQHPKGYRALVLEIGHISQAFYLSAHELGLGAFVTAAINEVDAEEAFGLDPAIEGPIAVCGFGWRGTTMRTAEFDPGGRLWARDTDP